MVRAVRWTDPKVWMLHGCCKRFPAVILILFCLTCERVITRMGRVPHKIGRDEVDDNDFVSFFRAQT